MKLIETTKPAERSFTLELNDDELKCLMWCLFVMGRADTLTAIRLRVMLDRLVEASGHRATSSYSDFDHNRVAT